MGREARTADSAAVAACDPERSDARILQWTHDRQCGTRRRTMEVPEQGIARARLSASYCAASPAFTASSGCGLVSTDDVRRLAPGDRKSTRLNSSHSQISYA